MKVTLKAAAALLAATMIVGLTACGGGGNNFTCADVVNKGDTQQLWLKSPESQLVINPDAVGAGEGYTDTRDLTMDPLCIGVNDASGNLVDTYNDILFLAESASANGIGGTVIYEESYDGAKGLSKADNRSSGNVLQFTIPADVTSTLTVRPANKVKVDYTNENLYITFTISAIPEGGSLALYPVIAADTLNNLSFQTFNAVGTYSVKLSDIQKSFGFKASEDGNLTGFNLAVTGAGDYSVTGFCVQEMPKGYRPAAKAASTEWAPYYMQSTLSYPQNSSVKTVDFFYGANAVSRKIIPTSSGSLGLCGKIKGTCTYDAKKNALQFDAGAAKYVVFLKRKGTVEYYKTLEDLYAGVNVLETADGASYWALAVSDLTESDANDSTAFYVAVGASATLGMSELMDATEDAISITKAKKTFSGLEEYWDAYIAENNVSDYITVIPEN